MIQVILGLFLLAFGLWSLFDSWNYVADFFKGFLPLAMILIGIVSIGISVFITEKFQQKEEV
ncbi:MAG: hypothetical protein HQK53_01230 [Oligoflexia bacterium]|nr:hypothetical protein [Oligoflexia bacterium]